MTVSVPSFTIITPCLNSQETIADCILSVRCQDYPAQQIIVDGCSTDGTLAVIQAHKHPQLHVISESDEGLYDAINKGISHAQGTVVGILQSDDFYAHKGVLSRVAQVFFEENVESCYGDLVYVDRDTACRVIRVWKSGDYRRDLFLWGWMPPHPTFFVRRSTYDNYGKFIPSMGSVADYELMLRFLFKHDISTKYLRERLVVMRCGGTSNSSFRNRIKANLMDRVAWRLNGLKPLPWTTILKPIAKAWQYVLPHVKAVEAVQHWWEDVEEREAGKVE